MMKFYLIAVLAINAAAFIVSAQQPDQEPQGAPEPYSYGYETDTHSAAEQKDPSGTVTGYYTIQDADGRQRRVEYVADAAGFRAKVQTNELGTKSANSADVEVLASPPNPEQLVYQAPPLQQQQLVEVQRQKTVQQSAQVPLVGGQRYFSQQLVSQQPFALGPSSYNYGTTGYGYYPGYGYGGQRYGSYSYGGYPYGVYGGYGNSAYPLGAYSNGGTYYSYNNQLPSQYYRSVQGGYLSGQPLVGYSAYGRNAYQTIPLTGSAYTSTTSQTSSTGPVQTQSRSANTGLTGSSNYIVLKKRELSEKDLKQSS